MMIFTYALCLLRGNRRGSASIEFALTLLPFFLLFAGTLEVGWYMTKVAILQNAVETSGRLIRTGQITTLSPFLDSISQHSFGIINVNNLSVNASAYNSFSAVPSPLPSMFNNSGAPINQNFQTGSGNQVVVLVVGYRYQFSTPLIGTLVDASGRGFWTFTSAMVIRNEPF